MSDPRDMKNLLDKIPVDKIKKVSADVMEKATETIQEIPMDTIKDKAKTTGKKVAKKVQEVKNDIWDDENEILKIIEAGLASFKESPDEPEDKTEAPPESEAKTPVIEVGIEIPAKAETPKEKKARLKAEKKAAKEAAKKKKAEEKAAKKKSGIKDKKKTKDKKDPKAGITAVPTTAAGATDSRGTKLAKEKKKRKKIVATILLLLLMFCMVGGGVTYIYYLRGKAFETPDHPFDIIAEFSSPIISGSRQRATTFASDICILETNVDLDGALLENTQKGLLFDMGNKEVLYAHGGFEKVYPASITKIMTGMLALKYGNLSDTIVITEEHLRLEEASQVCGFRPGDVVTLEQLLNALLVYSGNDAAAAIAEHVGGTTENFVKMMNQYAAELGCTGTHFMNPHGLHDENHYTTCYDIYLMLKEALNYPQFIAISKQPYYTMYFTRGDGSEKSIYLEATDHYLTGAANTPKGVSVLGGKTGTTSLAGNCLALLCQDAYGKPYCSIVMGAKTKDVLYEQMNSLLIAIRQ